MYFLNCTCLKSRNYFIQYFISIFWKITEYNQSLSEVVIRLVKRFSLVECFISQNYLYTTFLFYAKYDGVKYHIFSYVFIHFASLSHAPKKLTSIFLKQ